jgi:hypothetical protein
VLFPIQRAPTAALPCSTRPKANCKLATPDVALDTANRAAHLIRHRQHPATGRLRDFRDSLARRVGDPAALQLLNDHLASLAA